MPLLYVDLIEGRAPGGVRALLDAIHDAVVEAFGVPPRDRYRWCARTRFTRLSSGTPVSVSTAARSSWFYTW
ncbi:MAG: tautomerase family protein [Mycobacterium sp.]|uniref:tautomerase family protein n=1 Tax=Mycobacterium sp. TaxID=1785 RepID=UPI003C752E6C